MLQNGLGAWAAGIYTETPWFVLHSEQVVSLLLVRRPKISILNPVNPPQLHTPCDSLRDSQSQGDWAGAGRQGVLSVSVRSAQGWHT